MSMSLDNIFHKTRNHKLEFIPLCISTKQTNMLLRVVVWPFSYDYNLLPKHYTKNPKLSLNILRFWSRAASWGVVPEGMCSEHLCWNRWHCRRHHTYDELCQEIQVSHQRQMLMQPFSANMKRSWRKRLERWQHGQNAEGLTFLGNHPAQKGKKKAFPFRDHKTLG